MLAFYNSTVGKKAIMAVTGVIGIGYVLLHVAGNLQAFAGREKINAYAALLHGPGAELLLVMRVVLVTAVILHGLTAWQLMQRARAARPVAYAQHESQVATMASRTMRWGGVLLLAFLAFHLRHFTSREIDPAGWAYRNDQAGRYDLYGNIVASFQIPWVSAVYLVAVAIMGLHLWHGIWSFGRSLGGTPPSTNPQRRPVAVVVAILIWLGFSIVPIAVLAGVIR
ncbi:MAG: succinate dehydrogenase cytochrome b subunit [Gemmatimonadota bacterium]